MQNLFTDTRLLDAACRERYGLSEDVMMENAAAGLERELWRLFANAGDGVKRRVLVLCGGGNNGADGYALARRLAGAGSVADVMVGVCAPPKSPLCALQAKRAAAAGVSFLPIAPAEGGNGSDVNALLEQSTCIDAVVDCIFGSGFHGELDASIVALMRKLNALPSPAAVRFRVACDVPTGLREDGTVSADAFCADVTVTMGALKLSLYSDAAKDVAGRIVCCELGVSRRLFEQANAVAGKALDDGAAPPPQTTAVDGGNAVATDSAAVAAADVGCKQGGVTPAALLLDAGDIALPERRRGNVHKGTFGHVVVASGEKGGAACIAGTAALRFGAGLVTLVQLDAARAPVQLSPELMTATSLPEKTSAVAVGMGLGRAESAATPWLDWLCAHPDVPCVIDADACYARGLPALLRARAAGVVLTPHPKEFQALLASCGLGAYSVADCVNLHPSLIADFCRAFPNAVLLVKGANVMIGVNAGEGQRLFVNPLGTAALATAGSGDVLAGLIAALLAQGRAPLDAACNASLAHALASRAFTHSYALSPLTLIEAVTTL